MFWITDYLILDRSRNSCGLLKAYEIMEGSEVKTHILNGFSEFNLESPFREDENFTILLQGIVHEKLISRLSTKARKIEVT